MQDGIDLITALAIASGDGAPAGAQVLELLHQRDPSARSGIRRQRGRRLPAERHRDQAGRPLHPQLAVVHAIRRCASRAIRGRRSSSCGRSRKWAGRASRSTRSEAPLANMGMQLFEPPNVGGWPLGAGWFSTATMLARSEFRRRRWRRARRSILAAALAVRRPDRRRPAGGDARSRHAGAARSEPAAGADVVPRSPAARGPAARSNSTRGPPAWRACSSAPPSTSCV